MKLRRQKKDPAQKAQAVEIPGLGHVEEFSGEYVSEPVPVPMLGDEIEFFVEGYDEDDRPQDFHAAIEAFLALDRSALEDGAGLLYAYYKKVRDRAEAARDGFAGDADPYADPIPDIAGPRDVLDHIESGFEVTVARDPAGDREVCVSVVCNCDWDRDHGVQIVFRQGREVSKVGQFDGYISPTGVSYD